MAYPTSVTTFTTKTSGQAIDEGHVNDLQTEVNSLEDGLLNGIKHDLTPSTNSTRALGTASLRWRNVQATSIACNRLNSTSLGVTGASTLGTLNVTGGSTMANLVVTNLQVTGGSSGITAGSTFVTLNVTGGSTLASLVVSSNVTVNGGQIVFPATQVASADAHTLDDYEEGTWLPVIGGSGGTTGQAYANKQGDYVKIGQMVFLHFRVALSTEGTITGSVEIQGLPFTSFAFTTDVGGGSLLFDSLATNFVWVGLRLLASDTSALVVGAAAAGTSNQASLSATNINNGTEFRGVIVYRASA